MQLRATRLTAIASAVKRAIQVFSPALLFNTGAQGVWYDPSDYTTLFQDSAGTTPVTAVEQPVGLMLDKSKGLVLGPELFSSFANTGTWTVSGTTYSITSAAAQTDLRVDFTGTAGKRYVVSFTATGVSGLVIFYPLYSSPSNVVNGVNTVREVSNAGYFIIRASAGTSATISNISVKELPGNHAFQATSASRPVLSARYNLLTKTEQFDDAAWVKSNVTVSANATTAPDGTTSADLVYPSSTGSGRAIYQQFAIAAGSYSISFPLKAAGKRWATVDGTNTTAAAYFDLQDGVVGTVAAGHTASISSLGSGWYRCTVTNTSAGGTGYFAARPVDANGTSSVTANGTEGIFIWGASLVPANQSTLPYQRVNTSTDYATTGFLPYLKFDGVDDSLSTNSINFTSTDKMSVFAGVRKLSDVQYQMLVESSTNAATSNGSFSLLTTSGASGVNPDRMCVNSRGTIAVTSEITGMPANKNYVFGMFSDITADSLISRVNGVQTTFNSADQGTGNYGNYPLYIGRRGGSSLPFNGQLYSMIIVGKAVTAGELSSSEKFVASKTGVTLT